MDPDDWLTEELDDRARRDAPRLLALTRTATRTEEEIAARAELWAAAEGKMLSAANRRVALELLDRVLDLHRGLQGIEDSHAGFWRIDALRDRKRHARHFALYSAAYLHRLAVSIALVRPTLGQARFERLFDEGCAELGVFEGAYATLRNDVAHVEHPARVTATRTYYKLLRATTFSASDDGAPWLSPVLDAFERAYKSTKGQLLYEGASLIAGNALEMLRGAAQRATLPVQAGVAEWLGDTRVLRRDGSGLITHEQARDIALVARPGDVVLERRNWFLSNVGLPGFWPHAALWLGSPAELSAHLDHDESVRAAYGGAFSEALQKRFPEAWAVYATLDPHAHPHRLIEAVSEGVVFASSEHSLGADYAAGLRPRRSKLEAAKAIERAFGYWGRPYDFDFDFQTDATLVCSELVYKSWEPREHEGVRGLRLDLVEILGNPTLPPNEIVAQYDREHGTPEQQLDFVFFLDGSESEGRAVEGDETAFRASHRRMKWDIAQK